MSVNCILISENVKYSTLVHLHDVYMKCKVKTAHKTEQQAVKENKVKKLDDKLLQFMTFYYKPH